MNYHWPKPKQVAALLGIEDPRTVVAYLRDPEHALEGVEIARNHWRVNPASLAAWLGITEAELLEQLGQLNGGAHGTDSRATGGPARGHRRK